MGPWLIPVGIGITSFLGGFFVGNGTNKLITYGLIAFALYLGGKKLKLI